MMLVELEDVTKSLAILGKIQLLIKLNSEN